MSLEGLRGTSTPAYRPLVGGWPYQPRALLPPPTGLVLPGDRLRPPPGARAPRPMGAGYW